MIYNITPILLGAKVTGMAYIDVMQLTPNNIVKGTDGDQWIDTEREKTLTPVKVPILPKAAAIIGG